MLGIKNTHGIVTRLQAGCFREPFNKEIISGPLQIPNGATRDGLSSKGKAATLIKVEADSPPRVHVSRHEGEVLQDTTKHIVPIFYARIENKYSQIKQCFSPTVKH